MDFNDILNLDELMTYTIETLDNMQDYYTGYGADIHNALFNMDYYIIGTYQAKEWLGSDVFEAIEVIKEYEQGNFGEVTTDFSSPEAVVNMYVYIAGEIILGMVDHLQNECFDRYVDSEDIQIMIDQLKEM